MTKAEIFNIPDKRPRVLVAPLDWGLGHATRCVPIISKLLQQNCSVIVAAEGAGKILLQKEFPSLEFIELAGYRMHYSRNRFWMPATLLLQFPKLLFRIFAERRWLKKIVATHKIDAVISDNRPGLSHTKIPCIYITHQLSIKTGNAFLERSAQKIHYHFINKYSACWVPDAGGAINLTGDLGHPLVLPKTPVTYLGPLSRFEKKASAIKYDLCILISGPEPQRTVFEKMILEELKGISANIILLRGLPAETNIDIANTASFEIYNHLPAEELTAVLLQSKMVICRSGYTTIMDLIKLQKKAILVPTPGQTEQEYLAQYLRQQQLFYAVRQENFSAAVIKEADAFAFTESSMLLNSYEKIIEDLVKELVKQNQ